ncbi:vinculin-like isoform X2 [Mercenaria mercenaria]|uniref:vinculin-like isoform X2 n=1 Tax=Mercenaria mercenaria TaxID=6596 RepID=UPI001E1DEC90|nr:vinculin-like isoform X2 [Mercenaria mercenaria]
MPVFHTKTIESILEPVAQQVSKLVILHEEAEDGNAMPDLARPIQVVKLAVDNLVKVGYETINSSDDQILKQDMPPALRRVEESSISLLQASEMLRSDPYSAPARKKLIDGSRGILQGTSALLLAFDESEVRKIIRVCKNVLEYLAITEVVDRMEDLVTYVKNLSPVLTRMTKEVDAREKELTHQVHREMLIRSLEQVKNLTPVLISGIKIFITAKQSNQGIPDAQTNRDYVVRKMSDEIHEIIRVLQLTTYDEEEWDADDITVMKKAQSAIEQKMKHAHDWLADPTAIVGSSGDKSLRQILEDARRIADCCTNPDDRERIIKAVSNLESMSQALNELRQQGKGNSPQAMSLAREMQQKLKELQGLTGAGIMNTERSDIRKPAPTVEGKVDQALRWLTNPGMDDRGLGEQATRMVVAEGRRIAAGCSGPQRSDLLRLCDETEILTNQLSDLIAKGQGNSPQAKAIARHLSEKLHALKSKIQEALVNQVAEDFIDITTPLKQLTEASMVPLGTAGREANFDDKTRNFEAHTAKLADTANMVATAGGCRNKKTVEEIFKASKQANDLTPQVTTAARIVFSNPDNQAAVEHFELLKKQWSDNMERMRNLVDEAVDSTALIKAEEEGILRDTDRVEDGIRTVDSPKIVTNASNIARRANRVLQVAQSEAENSEDPAFVDNVNQASEQLRSTITPMVQCAKEVSMSPQDQTAANNWRKTNQRLINAVGDVRKAVDTSPENHYAEEMFPPPPDLSQLHISEPTFTAPPPRRPPPPPLAPSQEFSDIFRLGSPKASADRPDGSSPIVYNSPHSTLRFYPSSAVPASKLPGEVSTTLSFNPVTRIRKQVPKKSLVLVSPAAQPVLQKTSITVPVNQHKIDLPFRAAMKKSQQSAPQRSAPPPPPVAPPIPPPPAYSPYYEDGPPRPPLPSDTMPPRPPPPETDDEDDMHFPIPQENQPIMMAAHALHMEAKQWSSKDNEIIAAAKRMAFLMVKLSQLVRGEGGTKKDLISTAKNIAEASEEVTRLAKKLAAECTDKKMRTNLLQVCERIPTIGTQLKILSTVKATMLGAQGSEEDQEATEMLVGNAQNLMQAVKETVRAAEAASIKIRVDSGYTIRWLRKRPWYT